MINLEDAFVLEKSTAQAMQQWLQENCVIDAQTVTSFAELYSDWLRWADAHRCYRSTGRRLAMILRYVGLKRCVLNSGRVRAYRGIALKAGGAK